MTILSNKNSLIDFVRIVHHFQTYRADLKIWYCGDQWTHGWFFLNEMLSAHKIKIYLLGQFQKCFFFALVHLTHSMWPKFLTAILQVSSFGFGHRSLLIIHKNIFIWTNYNFFFSEIVWLSCSVPWCAPLLKREVEKKNGRKKAGMNCQLY